MQSRLIPLFHYALRDGGYLLLGTSETVSRHTRLLNTIDKTHRIFQRRNLPERTLPEFPLTTPDTKRRAAVAARAPGADGDVQGMAERHLPDRYAPAYVLVNEDGELLFMSERVGRFFDFPAGAPTHNLFNIARRGLRLELRAGLHQAISKRQVAARNNIGVGINGGRQVLDNVLHPLHQSNQRDALYMVVFKEVGQIIPEPRATAKRRAKEVESATVVQLEAELKATRERLQITTEELESSNEELKSSNEELSSINEELQ